MDYNLWGLISKLQIGSHKSLSKLDKSTQEEKATGQLNKDNPSRVPL